MSYNKKNGNLLLSILVSVLTFFTTVVDQKHKLSGNQPVRRITALSNKILVALYLHCIPSVDGLQYPITSVISILTFSNHLAIALNQV